MFAFFTRMFAFANRMFAFSVLASLFAWYTVFFRFSGCSHVGLSLKTKFKRVEVELCVQHYLPIPSQVTRTEF